MKFWEYFLFIVEIVTPQYIRKVNGERYTRLSKFFEERNKINHEDSKLSDSEKIIQLNSCVAALTGVSFSNIEEFNFFIKNFDPNNFEKDYWAFSRNRLAYELNRNETGEILSISIIRKQKWVINLINWALMFLFLFTPSFLIVYMPKISTAFQKDFHIPEAMTFTVLWLGVGISLLTLIKVLYDWSAWADFNKLIIKKYSTVN